LGEEVDVESEARVFLGQMSDAFVKYVDECESLSRTELGGTISPDIVAKKDGDIYLVEVKANEAKLAPLQRRALGIAAKYGFKAKVVRVIFEAHCSEEEV
jgi:predicted RecB family endonuclease